ncbi:hypothetical protein HMPREF9700_00119 [Bergeyella zoohelcum CCUG 30536]|uniref:Uncharacterized protein n=1 Tax=Bergeyella zoohelcum TaxID=1015 RepID=A0A380ZTA5_9FLAO|nr:hypothetical protein HMPREF9700_00119 [Bergeyella zoohelcum CCUG 30536]SUV52214.1 Uncharacterised protein [Bergeyella zoohelcum]
MEDFFESRIFHDISNSQGEQSIFIVYKLKVHQKKRGIKAICLLHSQSSPFRQTHKTSK